MSSKILRQFIIIMLGIFTFSFVPYCYCDQMEKIASNVPMGGIHGLKEYQGKLYAATNNGLFKLNDDHDLFEQVEGEFQNQEVRQLTVDDKLTILAANGLFETSDGVIWKKIARLNNFNIPEEDIQRSSDEVDKKEL